MEAIAEVISRAQCLVADGSRDVDDIVREAYDLEYSNWFLWELLDACCNPGDLVTPEIQEALIDYIKTEAGEEIQDLIDDAVQREEDADEAENVYYDLGLDKLDESLIGNREREVFADLCKVERITDNGHELYKFFDGIGYGVTWDETQHRFIG